ncbi:MAG TPA: PsiF family protein, partial [Burkholderiales bacterium]|nr:PsiF family protein [Burkholderiales bacterium]
MLRILMTAAALTAMNYAHAQDQKLTAQQERMKTCNAQAGEKHLKGDERQDFMSSCLKGEDHKPLTAQQEKMKTCNQTASERSLKGDERRSFMSECLSADGGEKLTAQQQKMQSCNRPSTPA